MWLDTSTPSATALGARAARWECQGGRLRGAGGEAIRSSLRRKQDSSCRILLKECHPLASAVSVALRLPWIMQQEAIYVRLKDDEARREAKRQELLVRRALEAREWWKSSRHKGGGGG